MSKPKQTDIPGIESRKPGRPLGSKNKKKRSKKKVQTKTVVQENRKNRKGKKPYTNAQKFMSLENRLNALRAEVREIKAANKLFGEGDGEETTERSIVFKMTGDDKSKWKFFLKGLGGLFIFVALLTASAFITFKLLEYLPNILSNIEKTYLW